MSRLEPLIKLDYYTLERFSKEMNYDIDISKIKKNSYTPVPLYLFTTRTLYCDKISENATTFMHMSVEQKYKKYIEIADDDEFEKIIKHFNLQHSYWGNRSLIYYDTYPCTDVIAYDTDSTYVLKTYYNEFKRRELWKMKKN